MSKNLFNGPLLFIILGGLVLLAYRYMPVELLLEKFKAGRGDAQIAEQAAPPVAEDYLGREAVQSEDPNMMFRDNLAEGREGLEQICKPAQAHRVLLADVEIAAAGFSGVDSAYWPEVSYIAIDCGDGRVHKSPKKRLEPHRLDTFEFQQQFSRRSQEFIASQGYFLKP